MKETIQHHRDRLWRCGFKRVYTHDEATKKVKQLRFTKDHSVRAFRCRLCRGWHIGNTEKMPKPKPPPDDIDIRGETYYY